MQPWRACCLTLIMSKAYALYFFFTHKSYRKRYFKRESAAGKDSVRYSGRTGDSLKEISIQKCTENSSKETSIRVKSPEPMLPTRKNEAYEPVDFNDNEGIYDIVN